MNTSILTDPHVASLLPYVLAILVFFVLSTGGIIATTIKVYGWIRHHPDDGARTAIGEVRTSVDTLTREFRDHVEDERERFKAFEDVRSKVGDVRERMIHVETSLNEMEKERRWRHDNERVVKRG